MRSYPVKTALALATFVVALTSYRRVVDPSKGLSAAIFGEAARLAPIRHRPVLSQEKTAPPSPLNGIQQPAPPSGGAAAVAGALPPVSTFLIDDAGSLDGFFEALRSVGPAGRPEDPKIVTVLHYGDSPTTADLITGDVRALLQQRFGDAGSGFLLTAKPWAWYQHRGIDLADREWSVSTAVGKGREEVYGIGGASFGGGPNASSRITLKGAPQTGMEVAYLESPGGGTLSVVANGTLLDSFSTAGDAGEPAWHNVALPPGTRTIDLKPVSGSVRLFGETLRTGSPGLIYDSLGLNGASTTVLSNGFNAAGWTAALRHERPDLVIVNYGTNESSFGSFVDKRYEPVLRTAIARIRMALPGVAILIMSPMDRGRRTGVDQIETFDTIPRIVAIQRRVAAEQKCAFFDTFNAMGGDGTMSRWYIGHPRLVSGDLIHPTPQGASLVAGLFVSDLMLGYGRFLQQRPGGVAPATAAIRTGATVKAAPGSAPRFSAGKASPPNE